MSDSKKAHWQFLLLLQELWGIDLNDNTTYYQCRELSYGTYISVSTYFCL